MRDPREEPQARPDDAIFRIGTALTSSVVAGAALGAVKATWSNIKITKAGGRASAFLQVLKVMGDYAATFGSAGTAFAAGDVSAPLSPRVSSTTFPPPLPSRSRCPSARFRNRNTGE